MANIISDALLVQNYVAGNEEALSTLIKRHESRIYGFIYSKLQIETFQMIFSKILLLK
jgi:RNA polymerase sigma-70 factor (ECF subfamily)